MMTGLKKIAFRHSAKIVRTRVNGDLCELCRMIQEGLKKMLTVGTSRQHDMKDNYSLGYSLFLHYCSIALNFFLCSWLGKGVLVGLSDGLA